MKKAAVEMYHLEDNRYQRMSVNERGRYPIPQLRVELGIWQGEYDEMNLPWLRWWDSEGNLLLIGEERAQQESLRAERERLRAGEEHLRAEEEKQRADRLAEKLREMGINPDEVRGVFRLLNEVTIALCATLEISEIWKGRSIALPIFPSPHPSSLLRFP